MKGSTCIQMRQPASLQSLNSKMVARRAKHRCIPEKLFSSLFINVEASRPTDILHLKTSWKMDRPSETGALAINQDEYTYSHDQSFTYYAQTARRGEHIEEKKSERIVQGNKSYPPVSQQRKPHADQSASDYYNSPYQQECRIPYAPPAYHSHRAIEGDGLRDARDEDPLDEHRQLQIQDQGVLYTDPGQAHLDHSQYPSAYHFQHEMSYAGYYHHHHHDMRAHPYWQYSDQGSYPAPPLYPSSALWETHEECQNYRPPTQPAHRSMAELSISISRTASLFMICDSESLSEYQCLIRKQIEIFSATSSDIELTVQGRNRHIEAGQVGVRCRHCADMPIKKRARGAVYYPSKLNCIYQAAQNMAAVHLTKHCTRVPSYIRTELLKKDRKSSAGSGKDYWAVGARTLGVVEVDGRLWFGDNMLAPQHGFGHLGQH